MFWGSLATLPREDFPPSFIRPFEGIFGRSLDHESNDSYNSDMTNSTEGMERPRAFRSNHQIIEAVKHSFERFITNLDIFVQLAGNGIL